MLKNDGFTLIELLVVITIVGLLASSVLAATSSSRASARDASQVNEMKQIQNALELYRVKNNRYPCYDVGPNPGCAALNINPLDVSDPGDMYLAEELESFLTINPSDSNGWDATLVYVTDMGNPANYRIRARFERDRRNNAGVTIPAGTWCRVDQGRLSSSLAGAFDPVCF